MKWKVLVSAPYMRPVLERVEATLNDAGCEVTAPPVRERLEEADLLPLVGGIDGVICGDDRFTRRVLESARSLKVISKWGTGIDSIDREACRELGIRVCNTPGAFTVPVADSVFAMMLAFARRTPSMDRDMKMGKWEKIGGFTLAESTLGIVGLGNIGREVATRARAFGMKVLGTDPVEPPPEWFRSTGVERAELGEVLAQSDFVTLHCDLNPTSYHLLNRQNLRQMKRSAVLINTSRGPVVDEPALIDALRHGTICGAGLDVFEVEPLPESSPLRRMEQVILAPHNANSSPAAWERVHRSSIENLLTGLREVQR
jgi:D-3-phosphoglycerate dehydrogenase